MGWFNKSRAGYDRQVALQGPGAGKAATSVTTPAMQPGPSSAPRVARVSNGLKDFLWHLDGIGHGTLLDLGPVWQTTVSFFIERGFKVYTEDLLLAWKEYLKAEEDRLRRLPSGEEEPVVAPAERAEAFLHGCLQYPEQAFDGVLAWDLLDYLDAPLVSRVVARLTDLVRDGGVVLAVFHSRKPEGFCRYRVVDGQNLELLPAPALFEVQRVYQNRELLNLFSGFQSSKTYVGRDQLREGLFIR